MSTDSSFRVCSNQSPVKPFFGVVCKTSDDVLIPIPHPQDGPVLPVQVAMEFAAESARYLYTRNRKPHIGMVSFTELLEANKDIVVRKTRRFDPPMRCPKLKAKVLEQYKYKEQNKERSQ